MSGVVGKDVRHDSALGHVTGESRFLGDLPPLAGEWMAAIVPAPVAHGEVRSLDVGAARAIPGVGAVLTASDLRGHNRFGPVVKDEDLLADQAVVFLGQPLAIIAARDAEALDAARQAVVADIAPLPPIFSIDQAIEANAFFGPPRRMIRGNVEAGFAEADTIVEGTLEIGGQEHFYFESQIAIAIPGEGGEMVVHSSTQHPSEVQAMVAEVLGVPFHMVECVCKRMGGGFGGKETQAAQPAMYAALLAQRLNQPVRFAYNKDDDMRFTGKRHPFKTIYRAGFTRAGRLTAVDLKLYSNGGCSTDLSFAVLERAMLHSDNAYFLPAVRMEGRVCRTNLPSNTAFRGFGGPQGVAGIEHILQQGAIALGMDALDVRRMNAYGIDDRNVTPYGQRVTMPSYVPVPASAAASPAGSPAASPIVRPSLEREEGTTESQTVQAHPPATDAKPIHQATGQGAGVFSNARVGESTHRPPAQADRAAGAADADRAHGNPLPELFDTLRGECDYDARRQAVAAFNSRSSTHLAGLALSAVKFGISFTRRTLNQANALVNIYTDGSVLVTTGATEMGQGVHTRIRQVVADELGVPLERVRVGVTSTAKNNNTSPTAASSGTDLNGAAARDACGRLRERLASVAADVLSSAGDGLAAEPARIRFADGWVFDERVPDRTTTFDSVVARAYELRVSLGERGHYVTPGVDFNRDTGKGTPFLYFTTGVACSEVRIDRFTGEMRCTRVDLIMDAGTPLNPGIDRGQVIGGFVQGMGWVTTEELVYKEDGTLLSHSPTTYKIPNVSDLPPVFNVRFHDNPHNVVLLHRSKAVGEPPLLLGLSVWLAAQDALSYACDRAAVATLAIPATAERLLAILESERRPAVGAVGDTAAEPMHEASAATGGDRMAQPGR